MYTRVTTKPISSSHAYAYDVYGDLTHKDGKELEYGNGNHQVSSVDGKAYRYDKNGNMVVGADATIEFNAHNKVTDLRENVTHVKFAYDMNQHRYYKALGSGNNDNLKSINTGVR